MRGQYQTQPMQAPRPSEWGMLTREQLKDATLMVHEGKGARYIPNKEVKEKQKRGWFILDKTNAVSLIHVETGRIGIFPPEMVENLTANGWAPFEGEGDPSLYQNTVVATMPDPVARNDKRGDPRGEGNKVPITKTGKKVAV